MSSQIPRVASTASELNDFTETKEGKKIYNVSKSRLVGLINLVHVFRVYLPALSILFIIGLAIQFSISLYGHRFDFETFVSKEIAEIKFNKPFAIFDLGWQSLALFSIIIWYLMHLENPVYLIDFSTFEPPASWKVSPEQLMELMKFQNCYTQESLDFMERMLKQSGVGPSTAWPPGIVQCLEGKKIDQSVEASRKEFEIVAFDCVQKILTSSKTKASEIDILVINCSLFSPTPSLCSIIINKFNMRSDVTSYNLSGMGCSAGLISLDLVKNMLEARPNSKALIISTEIITPNLYHGNERAFLLQNTLFRCGAAAILLSNKWTDAFKARFKLLNCVRTHYVGGESFGCVYETEDETLQRGVRLSKDIVKVAGRAMEKNLTTLGPYVLPLSEQLKTGFWMLARFLGKKFNMKINPYIPDFKRGIDHFCIHAGGRGVIDGIEKNLQLNPVHVEASRQVLYRYGNTSSSSIWYELEYICKNMNLKRGHRVLQLGFGSGFKCNSAVWICLSNRPLNSESDETKKKLE